MQTPDETPETPDPTPPPAPTEDDWLVARQPRPARSFEEIWGWGHRLTWLPGLILAISAFTDWYVGSGQGQTASGMGWPAGALGTSVFIIVPAVWALLAL